jgi:hypothetical protein
MYIVDRKTQENQLIRIVPVETIDFKRLTKKRYAFSWQKLKDEKLIYKLTIAGGEDILGIIWLAEYPAEERLEIKLLAVSIENVGTDKQYERIAGCLIAFTCREAIRRFKNYPAVSLVPKTELKLHYIRKYGMQDAGWQLYLEDQPLIKLVEEYLS